MIDKNLLKILKENYFLKIEYLHQYKLHPCRYDLDAHRYFAYVIFEWLLEHFED